IGHAVGQAVSGDTVKVREGTYNENNVTLNKDIILRGGYYDTDWKSDPANHPAIVDAQGAGRVFYVFGNPTIEGFTIRGGGTAGSGGGIYIYSQGSPIIRGNVITGNTAGVHGGGIHNELGNPTIEQNTLAYNEASRGGGFSSAAGSPGFWSNMVYDNAASTNGGGVYVTGGNARIWHDTIYHNTAQNGGGVYLSGGSPVVSNTIVVKNTAIITGGGIYKQAVGAALDYNDVWDNTNGDYVGATAGPHSISDDPDFLNETARDLHLGFSSPCENAGDTTSVAEDYDGQPRTMGETPDIGADEVRQLGVELEPDYAKSGDPGTQITYDHVVTNTGNYTDTFTISASSSHGWTVETPSNPVAVGPGQSAGIQVRVTIPSDAVWGVEDRTVVTATSGINPALSDTALDTTTVNLECGIAWLGQLAPWHRSGADTEIGFGQELENQDNYTETFDISWSWSGDEWPVIVSPDPVTLGPDTSRTIWFTVTVPPGGDLMVNHLTITATATTNCSDSIDPPAVHTFVINQDPGLTLVQNESGTDDPGQIVTYEHLLTNTGNYYDNTIWLTWQTNPSWSVMVNEGAAQPLEISLAQDETVTITVDVIIPDEATCGMSNTTIITATSWAGYYAPDYQVVRVSVTDTTAVRTVYGVELAPDLTGNINSDPSQPVTITYNHRLTNTGNCVQQFGFLYHSSLGFTVTVPSSVWLNPIEAEGVTVYVTMPPTTTSDLLVDTTVITTYHWEAMGLLPSDIVVDTTIVNQVAGVTLAPDNTGVVTQPSSTDVRVLYTHTLTNSGNYTDAFDLTWLNEDGWRVDVNGQIGQPAEVTVGSNLATVITAEVTVPSWIYTITNRMVITAASQFSPTVTASAVNTTTVRRPHVTLQPDYTQNVAPGDVITHVHTLTNTGGVSDSYAITYHSSLGWAAVVPTTDYTLPPGGTAPVTATISVPTGTDIISGTLDRLVITATSQITAVVYDTAVDLTTVPYAPGAALTPTPYNGQGRAGVPIPYTHTLTNLGNYTESFRLQVWSEFANGSVSPEWVYDLGPGESYTPVIVTVLLPTHAAAGETEETQVLVSFAGERIVAHDYTLVTASSGTRYVAPEGTNDNNSCLVPYDYGPCATVQQAVDQALAGDEAHIAQGIYTNVHVTGGYTQAVYLDKNVTLLGGYVNGDWSATPDPTTNQTVLNAGGQGRVVYVAAGVTSTIEGF
ncbi:MAG: hypothetical protein KKC18_12470, partial [Chloroflexi bacterium]|nr:hypothetical protein [Chloroflexota bacterium]